MQKTKIRIRKPEGDRPVAARLVPDAYPEYKDQIIEVTAEDLQKLTPEERGSLNLRIRPSSKKQKQTVQKKFPSAQTGGVSAPTQQRQMPSSPPTPINEDEDDGFWDMNTDDPNPRQTTRSDFWDMNRNDSIPSGGYRGFSLPPLDFTPARLNIESEQRRMPVPPRPATQQQPTTPANNRFAPIQPLNLDEVRLNIPSDTVRPAAQQDSVYNFNTAPSQPILRYDEKSGASLPPGKQAPYVPASVPPAAIYGGAPTMPAQVVNAISQGQPPQKTYPPDRSEFAGRPWRDRFYIDSLKVAEMRRISDSLKRVARESANDFYARKAAEAQAAQEAQARSAERPVFRRAPDTTNTVGGSQPPTPTQHPDMPKYSGAPSGDAGDAEIAEWLKTIPPEDRVKISRHEFPNAGAKSDYLWRSAEIYMNRQQGNSGKKKK